MIQLVWVRYVVKNHARLALLVSLGVGGDKLYALKASEMSPAEIMLIRKNADKLGKFPLEERITWIKSHCPECYKHSFRVLQSSKTNVIYTYDIKAFVDAAEKAKTIRKAAERHT